MTRQKVVVVGGGIAGLTVAHELIERDFDVVVYERRPALGGKAASVLKDGRPGEHGFRFFPAWYRHLPDTMRRIPLRGKHDQPGQRTVFDHLVPTQRNLLLQYGQDPLPIVLHAPKSSDQAQALFAFLGQLQPLGLRLDDIRRFFKNLAAFLRTPIEERKRKYDEVSWWEFVDADARSEAFRTLTVASTRTLLAAKAEHASAYTIATMAVRTLFDAPLASDKVLDGPTSDVWIEPWRRYLESRGVRFALGHELDAITFSGIRPEIESLVFYKTEELILFRRLRALQRSTDANAARQSLGKLNALSNFNHRPAQDLEAMRQVGADELESFFPTKVVVEADYFVFALPVEQMAYYVNRSTTMTTYDPSLSNIVRLSSSVDWMVGIQFYLRTPLQITPGHIVCADSEWALTALEQTQFWRNVDLPDNVESILSVDVSAWDRRGRALQKEAFRCTPLEIATEVWAQLKASLNRSGQQEVVRDDMLVAGQVDGSYHLDDSVIDRLDRKKQAAYARGIDRDLGGLDGARLSADTLLREAAAMPDAPFMSGDRMQFNAEPLLINRPGFLRLRPTAKTKIANMFVAGDYVDTETNLACMEGANESARHAANAILRASGSRYDPSRTWRFDESEVVVRLAAISALAERLPGVPVSLQAATGAIATLGTIAFRATQNLKQVWKRP